MTNKYTGVCIECKVAVPQGNGETRRSKAGRWYVLCADHARLAVRTWGRKGSYTRFSSGAEIYRNSRGRCEDAPCCGCCS